MTYGTPATPWPETKNGDPASEVMWVPYSDRCRGPSHLASRPGSNFDLRASLPIALRVVPVPCRVDAYLLGWDCFIEAMGFDSI